MAKRKNGWTYKPVKPSKARVPDEIKTILKTKANELIKTILKPMHIKQPPVNNTFNYIVDIYSKWYRNYFYFIAKYSCPGPRAITPFFETKFARIEYINNNCYNLSYMRHTEQWWEIYTDLTIDECLKAIRDEPHFLP